MIASARTLLILSCGLSCGLAFGGCTTSRFSSPGASPVAIPVASAASGPSVEINAPGQAVRQVIAQRARQRGTGVVANDVNGVVLERDLPQTSPVLEASCGPQVQGRRIRIDLRTAESGGVTLVSEQRTVLDPGGACPVRLNPADIDEANTSLGELKRQVESSRLARR